jgi:hypothetical protein
MEGLVVLGVLIAALALLAILAVMFGADSRDTSVEPRSPERGLIR